MCIVKLLPMSLVAQTVIVMGAKPPGHQIVIELSPHMWHRAFSTGKGRA